MISRFRFLVPALLLAGCYSNESPNAPDLSNNDGLFKRFVAIGTSISSGFQSAGINDSTQERAFPVIVAHQAGASFGVPSLNLPGCPAPFVNNVTQARVGNAAPTACTLRQQPIPYQVNNLAVPGLTAPDLFTNANAEPGSTYGKLQLFFLGGQTPWNAVKAAKPTLLSIEIGPSDVIGAVSSLPNPGDSASITPFPIFAENYVRFADSVATLGTKVVAFTVPDITQIPYTSRGSVYWCLKNGCPGVPVQFPPTVTVDNNCASALTGIPGANGDSILVPWTIGVAGVLQASAPPFTPFNLDCSNTLEVVTPAEYSYIRNTTDQMNGLIRNQASQRGWALVESGNIFAQLQVQGSGVPLFPDISHVATGGPILFGDWFSLDGFHPSTATHAIAADTLIAVINRSFGTEIPFPEVAVPHSRHQVIAGR